MGSIFARMRLTQVTQLKKFWRLWDGGKPGGGVVGRGAARKSRVVKTLSLAVVACEWCDTRQPMI